LEIGLEINLDDERKGLRKSSKPLKFFGGRWATRTPGLWFRRPTLYPPELIARKKIISNCGTLSRRIGPGRVGQEGLSGSEAGSQLRGGENHGPEASGPWG
jgi:hypothetical protein